MPEVSLPDRVRAACAWVAGQARLVRIEEEAVPEYAAALPAGTGEGDPCLHADPEVAAAFAICMNAINFGSGWWPTIRKRSGLSGYRTMASGVRSRFSSEGPWSPEELAAMTAPAIAAVVDQAPDHPLMGQFAAALRDVGAHLLAEHGGSFFDVVEGRSAPEVASLLTTWESFADVSIYMEREVAFYKRAQLAAADLSRTAVPLEGVDQLTAFADNLVPHVLRLDGILQLDPALTARIEAGQLLDHGSPEEVELRACAVHAVELLASARGADLAPAQIDAVLWERGGDARYKSLPRPRSRNTAY
jgi:Potential Queuosine, Q, salvage protein family